MKNQFQPERSMIDSQNTSNKASSELHKFHSQDIKDNVQSELYNHDWFIMNQHDQPNIISQCIPMLSW
jgi:hypothetical protein